jgi:hypothetical protein
MTYITPMTPTLLATLQLADAPPAYSGGGLPKGWIMIVVGAALYVLPSLLAWKAESPRRLKITLINLLLGWTVIGWIAALVMTYVYQPPPDREPDIDHVPGSTPRPR